MDIRQFLDKVKNYILQWNMLEKGDRVAAGISGGADSVCLLYVLQTIREEWNLDIRVVHVNHGLRKEAVEDADYVRKLCARFQLPFTLVEVDVAAMAAQKGLSCEEAGRMIRYEAFDRALHGKGKIAVAHNLNDRAETLLFHLFRGTGLEGMASVRPVRGHVVRPLLCMERSDIEQWLREQAISWCTDATNEEDEYTRNRIRHLILPTAEKEICKGAARHLFREAQLLQETADYVLAQAGTALDICRLERKSSFTEVIRLDIDCYHRQEPLIQTYIIKLALSELSGGGKDITTAHLDSVQSLFEGQGGRKAILPNGIRAVRNFDEVVLTRMGVDKIIPGRSCADVESCRPVFRHEITDEALRKGSAEIEVPELGIIEFSLHRWEKSGEIPQKRYTKWIDYDKIETLPAVRYRQPGDYLTINDGLQKKKLKEYMIQEKIPADSRDRIALVADENHIIWIPGYRISSAYRIDSNTKNVLVIQIKNYHE